MLYYQSCLVKSSTAAMVKAQPLCTVTQRADQAKWCNSQNGDDGTLIGCVSARCAIKVRGSIVQTLCIEKDSYMDAI